MKKINFRLVFFSATIGVGLVFLIFSGKIRTFFYIESNNRCLDSWNISTQSDYEQNSYRLIRWRQIGPKTHVYSAYLDPRDPCSILVTVFGFGTSRDPPLFATLTLQNGAKVRLAERADRKALNVQGIYEDRKLGPYAYSWQIPAKESLLNGVKSITVNQFSSGVRQEAEIAITLPVYSTKTFGVCVDSPLFGQTDPSTIIESVEVNKVFGAEWFTIYLYEAGRKARILLREYIKEGVMEVVEEWGKDLPTPVHYYGQELSINECAYRNMFRVKYLVYADLDEFIVPRKSLDWRAMMESLEDAQYGTYAFRHVFFLSKQSERNSTTKEKFAVSCQGGRTIEVDVPKILSNVYRSPKIYPNVYRSKYITKPLFTSKLGVHLTFEHDSRLRTLVVMTETALLHHYRTFDDRYVIESDIQKELVERYFLLDKRALVFKRHIMKALKRRSCKNMRRDSLSRKD